MADVTFRYDRAPTGELSGESLVEQTEEALSGLGQSSSHAEEEAARAVEIATAADGKADQAVATAGQAQSTANSALTTAQSAQSSATQAVQTAQSAVTTAQGASQTAQNAVSTAQSAVTTAQSAQTAAENAESRASTSASAAEGSANSASAAQTAAESAQTSASQSATIATQAQSAASQSAQSAANSEQTAQLLANPNRYSAKTTSLTLSAGQTINISDLDGANVAVNNKVIDAVGNIFTIASIDETNQTVTLVAADPSATPPILGYWKNPNRPPVGSYIYFAGTSVPTHYLLCNGSAVSRTTYSALFAVIGTKYGAGNGSTTFNLPNLIDKFLEGSGTAGTVKNAGLPNITGNTGDNGLTTDAAGYGAISVSAGNLYFIGGEYKQKGMTFDASRSSSIYGNSSTVQPPALTALPCIRYE